MKPSLLISLFLSLVFALQPIAAAAMETDQYNLPPVPLADIGDEVSEYVEGDLRMAAAIVNGEIASHQACLGAGPTKEYHCGSAENERRKLDQLRSNDAVARELYKLLGDGNIFTSYFGDWINSHSFSSGPARYKAGYFESIYQAQPIDYATLSPTVRLFGIEFGTDKLDHFAQQGYTYYKMRAKAIAGGKSSADAVKKAVKWGRMTERTYYGMIVSGVYSNADLYANYAGMKFYQGLTEPVSIGAVTRPAILELNNGLWAIASPQTLRADLLKPFFTDHLNEALNPSGYGLLLYPSILDIVKENSCPKWRKMYPALTHADFENQVESA